MLLSVGICTWNRAASLDRTLAALATVHIPTGWDWEVLVVNNNSTDDTDQVIARHAMALPIRRVFGYGTRDQLQLLREEARHVPHLFGLPRYLFCLYVRYLCEWHRSTIK